MEKDGINGIHFYCDPPKPVHLQDLWGNRPKPVQSKTLVVVRVGWRPSRVKMRCVKSRWGEEGRSGLGETEMERGRQRSGIRTHKILHREG